MGDNDDFVLWVGNLHSDVTEELLFELFLQSGPLQYVKLPKDKNFAFICFKHTESVQFAMNVSKGLCLFGQMIHCKFRQAKGSDNKNQDRNRGTPNERLDSGRKRDRSRTPPLWKTPQNNTPSRRYNTNEDPYSQNQRYNYFFMISKLHEKLIFFFNFSLAKSFF